jgi:hypothetical protein
MPIKMPLGKRRPVGNTQRENRLEELGRVDAERAYTKKGKRDIRAEKHRIRRELKKEGGKASRKVGRKAGRKAGPEASSPPKYGPGRPRDPREPKKYGPGRPRDPRQPKKYQPAASGGLIKGKPKIAKRGWK